MTCVRYSMTRQNFLVRGEGFLFPGTERLWARDTLAGKAANSSRFLHSPASATNTIEVLTEISL